jgi:putative transposase
MGKNLPKRKVPAHLPMSRKFKRSTVVFLTVCSASRKILFDRPQAVDVLVSTWTAAADWQVGHYVVMPDHIHFFASPGRFDAPPLRAWVKYWKTLVSRQWLWPSEHPLWQKSFWDTQLRCGDSYEAKWQYVQHNPVRAGLCVSPSDWPYQGQLNRLAWHE